MREIINIETQEQKIKEFLELYQKRFNERVAAYYKLNDGNLQVRTDSSEVVLDSWISGKDLASRLSLSYKEIREWIKKDLDPKLKRRLTFDKRRKGGIIQVRSGILLNSVLPFMGLDDCIPISLAMNLLMINPNQDQDVEDFFQRQFGMCFESEGRYINRKSFLRLKDILHQRWLVSLDNRIEKEKKKKENARIGFLGLLEQKIQEDLDEIGEPEGFDIRLRRALQRLYSEVPKNVGRFSYDTAEIDGYTTLEDITKTFPDEFLFSSKPQSNCYNLIKRLNLLIGVSFSPSQIAKLMVEGKSGKSYKKAEVLEFYRRALRRIYPLTTHDLAQLSIWRAGLSYASLTNKLFEELIIASRPVNFNGKQYYTPFLVKRALDIYLPNLSSIRFMTLADARRYVIGNAQHEFGVKVRVYDSNDLVEIARKYALEGSDIVQVRAGRLVDKYELDGLIKLMLRDIYNVKGLELPKQYASMDYKRLLDARTGGEGRYGIGNRIRRDLRKRLEEEERMHEEAEQYALEHDSNE